MLRRWLNFNVVGALGVIVQLFFLAALTGWLGVHYLPATALAVESAVLHNFFWHEKWTWADRRGNGASVLQRLLAFNSSNGVISLGGNLVVMRLLTGELGLHYLAANLLAITLCSLINFLSCDRFVFKRSGHGLSVQELQTCPSEEQRCAKHH
jgi:putative flippase GtrA